MLHSRMDDNALYARAHAPTCAICPPPPLPGMFANPHLDDFATMTDGATVVLPADAAAPQPCALAATNGAAGRPQQRCTACALAATSPTSCDDSRASVSAVTDAERAGAGRAESRDGDDARADTAPIAACAAAAANAVSGRQQSCAGSKYASPSATASFPPPAPLKAHHVAQRAAAPSEPPPLADAAPRRRLRSILRTYPGPLTAADLGVSRTLPTPPIGDVPLVAVNEAMFL